MTTLFKLLLVCCFATLSLAQTRFERLKVSPVVFQEKLPLSEALAQIGLHVKGGYVSFGIDMREKEPLVTLNLPREVMLDEALAQVVSNAEGYTFKIHTSHLVEVYRAQERADPNDHLNVEVNEFNVENEPAAGIFSRPGNFITELSLRSGKNKEPKSCATPTVGVGFGSPGISLTLRKTKLVDILNAIAIEDARLDAHRVANTQPVGWVHMAKTDSKSQITTHEWRFIATVPRDWAKFANKKSND